MHRLYRCSVIPRCFVVPAKAGIHTAESLEGAEGSLSLAKQPPVVMAPGLRQDDGETLLGALLHRHRLLHRGDQLAQREWLWQERELLVLGQALFERILRISRDEDDLHLRIALAHRLEQRGPV